MLNHACKLLHYINLLFYVNWNTCFSSLCYFLLTATSRNLYDVKYTLDMHFYFFKYFYSKLNISKYQQTQMPSSEDIFSRHYISNEELSLFPERCLVIMLLERNTWHKLPLNQSMLQRIAYHQYHSLWSFLFLYKSFSG